MEGLLVVSVGEKVRTVKAEREAQTFKKERIVFSLKFRSELLQIYFCMGSFRPLHCHKENLSSSSFISDSTNNVYGAHFTTLIPEDS